MQKNLLRKTGSEFMANKQVATPIKSEIEICYFKREFFDNL
jgi:hypothetical protein